MLVRAARASGVPRADPRGLVPPIGASFRAAATFSASPAAALAEAHVEVSQEPRLGGVDPEPAGEHLALARRLRARRRPRAEPLLERERPLLRVAHELRQVAAQPLERGSPLLEGNVALAVGTAEEPTERGDRGQIQDRRDEQQQVHPYPPLLYARMSRRPGAGGGASGSSLSRTGCRGDAGRRPSRGPRRSGRPRLVGSTLALPGGGTGARGSIAALTITPPRC